MHVLVTAARGKTGRRVIAALQRKVPGVSIRALSRGAFESATVEAVSGDMDDPHVRKLAVAGMDVVIHYAPPMDPRESAMGTGMIDAAVAAGVSRFVYVSVIHPEIDDLPNHQAKLRVEAHLINSGIEWSVLRPQHYFQNIDIADVVKREFLTVPYPAWTRLGHVDMNDLADAVAKVSTEPGHAFATYDIASAEHLTVDDICTTISEISGKIIRSHEISPSELVSYIKAAHPLTAYSEEAFHRLFGYYSRRGIYGNPNVLSWLLERQPGSFRDYVERSLAGTEGLVGNRA